MQFRIIASVCFVLCFTLAAAWNYENFEDWGRSCAENQQSPIALDSHLTFTPKPDVSLHINYEGSELCDFKSAQNATDVRVDVSCKYAQAPHVKIGLEASGAVACDLQYISLHAPEHRLKKKLFAKGDHDDLDKPLFEIQFSHLCNTEKNDKEALKTLEPQIDKFANVSSMQEAVEDVESIASVEQTMAKSLAKFENVSVMREYTDYIASPSFRAFQKDIEHLADNLKDELAHYHGLAQKADAIKGRNQVRNSFHRVSTSSRTILSVFVFKSSRHEDTNSLLSFMQSALSGELYGDGKAADDLHLNDSLLLPEKHAQSLHYVGSDVTPPCDSPLFWYLLLKPQMVSEAQAHTILRAFPNASLKSRPLQHLDAKTDIHTVPVDSIHLADIKTRFSVQEKESRKSFFGVRMLVVVSLGALACCVFYASGPTVGAGAYAYFLGYFQRVFWMVPIVVMLPLDFNGFLSIPSLGPSIGEYSSASFATAPMFSWWFLLDAVLILGALAFLLASFLVYSRIMGYEFADSEWFFEDVKFYDRSGPFVIPGIVGALFAFRMVLEHFNLGWLFYHSQYANLIASVIGNMWMAWNTITHCWWVLPIFSYREGKMNCIDGVDWEVHSAFCYSCMLHSMYWCAIKLETIVDRGFPMLGMIFVLYNLAMMDLYMDVNFIGIAWSCGSVYGTYALYAFLAGVLGAQYLLGAVMTAKELSFKGVGYSLLLYPPELQISDYVKVPTSVDSDGEFRFEEVGISAKYMALIVVVLSLARSICEDAPQCIIQWLFTVNVKRNPMIIFSIGTSILTMLFNLLKACRFFFLDY